MGTRIVFSQGDIAEAEVDAIVNAANTDLMLGAGVAGAIRRKGGPEIAMQCSEHGPVKLGGAALTGAMKARYVIHAASMHLGGTTSASSLRDATRNSLLRAEEKGRKSLAFPAVGTGVAGFSMDQCAEIMLEEVQGAHSRQDVTRGDSFRAVRRARAEHFSKEIRRAHGQEEMSLFSTPIPPPGAAASAHLCAIRPPC